MSDDDFQDDLVEYDAAMGADAMKCPYCGATIPYSASLEDEIECPECGRNFPKD